MFLLNEDQAELPGQYSGNFGMNLATCDYSLSEHHEGSHCHVGTGKTIEDRIEEIEVERRYRLYTLNCFERQTL
jgi:hypothetical protein